MIKLTLLACMFFRPQLFTDTKLTNSSLSGCINECLYDSHCNYIIHTPTEMYPCLLATNIEMTDNKNMSKVHQFGYTKTDETVPYYSQKCVRFNDKLSCNQSRKCKWLVGQQPYNREVAVVGENFCGRKEC